MRDVGASGTRRGAAPLRRWFFFCWVGFLPACTFGPRVSTSPAPASETEDAVGDESPDRNESTTGGAAREESALAQVEPGPRVMGTLEAEGFLPAVLMTPSGEVPHGGYRVVFIAHGAGGRGEHHCTFWDPALSADYILICPMGALLDRRHPKGGAYFPDHLALRRELLALLEALERSRGEDLKKPYRYMGYSQGATMGALAAVGEIPVFDEFVLVEGGGENWTHARVKAFADAGGKRVLLACGTRGCFRHAERAKTTFEELSVPLYVVHAPGAGHTYGGPVGQGVFEVLTKWERERIERVTAVPRLLRGE